MPATALGGDIGTSDGFGRDGERDSSFDTCVSAAAVYGLSKNEAREIIDNQINVIEQDWDEVADMARLGNAQRNLLRGRQILNPACFYGYARTTVLSRTSKHDGSRQ